MLPFPIAFPYHLIDAARTPADKYRRLLHCFEAVLRYLAVIQLSDYLAADCPDPKFNSRLLELLAKNRFDGHWVEIIREVARLQHAGRFEAFMPEIPQFYFGTRSKPRFTPDAELLDSVLLAARNDYAHTDRTPPTAEAAERMKEYRPRLDRLLTALGFLARYPLYVPTACTPQGVMTCALHLVGPTDPPRFVEGLDVPLAPRVRGRVEYDTAAVVCDPDDQARQLLLAPLALFVTRDSGEDIFLFQKWKVSGPKVSELYYQATRVNQEPLHIKSGAEFGKVLAQFRELLGRLNGATLPPPESAAPPPQADLYFAAQREVIRERVAGFVGRAGVEAAVERFVAGHPRGYVIIHGGPGQGKTAVACRQVTARKAVHHLVSGTGGRDVPHLILGSLIAQLAERTGGGPIPDGPTERLKRFDELLGGARAGGPLVLVVDALDELSGEADALPAFLPVDPLPPGVFVVVTSRPGARLDRLLDATARLPRLVIDMPPLSLEEVATILRARQPGLTNGVVERVAAASQGNPLYLLAAADELARNPAFDLSALPPGVEGFFRLATADLQAAPDSLGRDVLGLLTVARKPLSTRELAQITGRRQREVANSGIAPVRQFLFEGDGGYSFYHARFGEFVGRELVYPDERAEYHRLLADWLGRPEGRGNDYRLASLAHHLYEAGDAAGLLAAVDADHLRAKAARFGYAVLEDVELVTRTLLAADDPAAVDRCVALVEGVRAAVGEGWRRRPGLSLGADPAGFRTRVVAPPVPPTPGVDVFVGMLPKIEVGADFVEVIPVGGGKVVLVLGDAPGAGLKPAFMARFLGSLIRRRVERAGGGDLSGVLAAASAAIAGADFFDPVSVQLAELDPHGRRVRVVNAGLPYPVLRRAGRQSDQLPTDGEPLQSEASGPAPPVWRQRHAEVGAGDVFVMATDGLTEAHSPSTGAFGYRFTSVLADSTRSARQIGEAILDDWRAHPRDLDYTDDTTVVVAVFRPSPESP